MTSGWAGALIALAALVGGLGGALWRGGRRDGKIDAVLEQLGRIVEDHEARLRIIEHIRAPRSSGRGGR